MLTCNPLHFQLYRWRVLGKATNRMIRNYAAEEVYLL